MMKYPGTDLQTTNLDWIIEQVPVIKKCVEEAETAQGKAEEAQGKAEEAQAKAEEAQGKAEYAQGKAEDAQAAAELAQGAAEYAQGKAEDAVVDAQNVVNNTVNQIELLQSRVDNIIPDGTQTEGNTELLDIRVGYDSKIYDSAGNAVRGQVSDLHSMFDKTAKITKWNIAEDAEILLGKYCDPSAQTAGQVITLTNLASYGTYKFEVNADTIYYFTTERFLNQYGCDGYNSEHAARTVVFSDADDHFISGSDFPGTPMTTPSGAKYAYVSAISLDEGVATPANVGWIFATKFRNHDHFDVSSILPTVKIPFAVQALRKPTFVFTFDDGLADDVTIKALFDKYGFKCGFALIANDLTDYDRYRAFQNEGFEILAHSVNGSPFTDITTAQVKSNMQGAIDRLHDEGFRVFGMVTPSTFFPEDSFDDLCQIYEYGFGYLNDGSTIEYAHGMFTKDVRQLERYSMESHSVAEILTQIDATISAQGFTIFYSHGLGTISSGDLESVLSYLKTKQMAGLCYVSKPNDAINNFYRCRHSDLLELYHRS